MSLGLGSFGLNQFAAMVLQSDGVTRCDLCSAASVQLYSQQCYFDSFDS